MSHNAVCDFVCDIAEYQVTPHISIGHQKYRMKYMWPNDVIHTLKKAGDILWNYATLERLI